MRADSRILFPILGRKKPVSFCPDCSGCMFISLIILLEMLLLVSFIFSIVLLFSISLISSLIPICRCIILECFHYPEKKHPHSLSISPQVLPCFAPSAATPSPWQLLIGCPQRLAAWGYFIEMGSCNMWLFVSDFSPLACFQGLSTLQYFVSFY